MPFMPMWRKIGDEIAPTSGVDTIRIPGAGEYATIARTADFLTITSGESGNAILKMDSGASQWQIKGADGALRIEDGTKRVEIDSTGLGFFAHAPVARQSKPANPTTDPASLQTATQALIDALGAYGLIA
jgi:hypothetical protein